MAPGSSPGVLLSIASDRLTRLSVNSPAETISADNNNTVDIGLTDEACSDWTRPPRGAASRSLQMKYRPRGIARSSAARLPRFVSKPNKSERIEVPAPERNRI